MEQSRHAHFLNQQQRMLKILAIAAVLTAALIAFLLSRYLLRPVRKLTKGTLAICERRFDTRVKINSSDEFGQLATDFNAMAKTLDLFEQQQLWIHLNNNVNSGFRIFRMNWLLLCQYYVEKENQCRTVSATQIRNV